MDAFMTGLSSMFKIKYLGKAKKRQEKELEIGQRLYAQTIAERFGSVKTSIDPGGSRSEAVVKKRWTQYPGGG